ncbi:MAG TPA: FG-GAP repeat protein [Anaerolineales bacterium]
MNARLTKQNVFQFFGSKKRLVPLGIALILLLSSVGYSLASGQVIDLSKNEENVVVRGTQAQGYLSEISASGDFTGDGISDLLLGAAGSNNNGLFSGAAFLIPGGKSIPAGQTVANAALTLYGASSNDILGHSATIGDVDGDNHPDLIVGADGTNNFQGSVYVIAGGMALPATIDLAKTPGATELTLVGPAAGARFGRSVATGDVNGDGIPDIIVGSYTNSPGGRTEAGAVYVFFGSKAYQGKHTNLTASQANIIIYGQSGAAASLSPASANSLFADENGLQAATALGDRLGRSVAVGDVNKDGIADIVAGAYGANAGAGKTYVFYGSKSLSGTLDLKANPALANVTLTGVNAGDESGFYVATGDLNKDGYADILTSAYFSQGYNNATGAETGTVYAVYGGSGLAGTISLTNASVTVYGAAAGDRLGRSIVAGDVNTDGYADMILGASRASPGGRTNAGEIYVIHGGSAIPASIQLSSASADMQILGAQGGNTNNGTCDETTAATTDCSDETGHSVAVGDVNGDHGLDIVAGAVFANNGSVLDTGAAYVIYGVGVGKNNFLYLPVANRTEPTR